MRKYHPHAKYYTLLFNGNNNGTVLLHCMGLFVFDSFVHNIFRRLFNAQTHKNKKRNQIKSSTRVSYGKTKKKIGSRLTCNVYLNSTAASGPSSLSFSFSVSLTRSVFLLFVPLIYLFVNQTMPLKTNTRLTQT